MLKTVIKNKLVEEYLLEHESEKDNIIVNALVEFILRTRKTRSNKAREFELLVNSSKKYYIDKKIDIFDIANEVNQ
jgi:hypothetical protein